MFIAILTVILAVAAFVAVFGAMALDDFMPMPIMGTIAAIGAAALVVGCGFGASAIVTYNTENLRPVLTETNHLRALNTGTDTEGHYFLLSGSMESGPSYTYLVEREDGGFEMTSIVAGGAIVYQDDSQTPHVITGQVRPRSTLWSILPLPAKAEFYVPVGSVQDATYRVDVTR